MKAIIPTVRHMPPPAPRRPALTDREIARMQFRVALLTGRAIPRDYAERWSDVLHHRDATHGDRRLCAECTHLRADWSCRVGGVVVIEQLQRCEKFGWELPAQARAQEPAA